MADIETDKKKEISKMKTFTVPFSLEEIKESFSIPNTKSSQDKIINQAFKFHSEGNISEAAKYYKYCIEQGFNDHRVFSNYGTILKELGKLQDAESLQRKAIKINPDYADAHSNLGNVLRELGKLKEAELSQRKAIQLNPNYSTGHCNLGIILYKIGKLKEAELSLRKAIELNPNLANAHLNLGIILKDLGKLNEAELSTRKAVDLNPILLQAHVQLGEILFELGKPEKANIHEWKAIEMNASSPFVKSYRKNAKLINKTAFYVFGLNNFNHIKPIIEINPSLFDIIVQENIDKEKIRIIRNEVNSNEVKISSANEIIGNNLIYEKLVSTRGDSDLEYINNKNNLQTKTLVPIIKLLGKKNIRFMYTAGKNKYTILSYWNKYYDGILCYGPYHEEKFKHKHKIATSQMGYPRFDKYFKPGFKRNYLIEKFKCDPKKKTIVWLPTWTSLSSIDKYYKVISSLRIEHNIVVRPHPSIKKTDPESYKKLFSVDFNYIDDNDNDNVQLYALADLMLFDYGGPMFGALYLNKNLAFLEMNLEAKNHSYLDQSPSEDYLKSFFPDRIAKLENLKSICNYCLNNPPNSSVMGSLREEFFNINYQGNSAERAYELLNTNNWLK